MKEPTQTRADSALPAFSLVEGGPFYRLRRAIGIVPEDRARLARRTALLVAVLWLPLVAGAIAEGRFLPGASPDPFLRHFGIHARFLLAIPLLFVAEFVMHYIVPPIVQQFVVSGLISGVTANRYVHILQRAAAFRDSIIGELLMLLIIVGSIYVSSVSSATGDESMWMAAGRESAARFGFAGWWFLYVCRPVFVGLLTLWVWRLLVGCWLLYSISRLDLRLIPTHPDHVGGLGFVQQVSIPDAWLVLAISVILAASWGHDVLYHGVHVNSLKVMMAVYAALVLLVFAGPLLLFSRNLRRSKRGAMLQYSALVGGQGRLVHRKWIEGQPVDDLPILDSPELGCVADTNAVFEAVGGMRTILPGKECLIPLALAVAIPMIPVFAIEVPVKDLLLKIVGTLL